LKIPDLQSKATAADMLWCRTNCGTRARSKPVNEVCWVVERKMQREEPLFYKRTTKLYNL
jgi:hypothetical protein